MAKKKSKDPLLKDERIPKLFGVVSLFVAVYLLIAFSSYLFTWKEDQSLVMEYGWGLLGQSGIQMDNWLGRLGAIVSFYFIDYAFGLAAYVIVALLFLLGINFIARQPLSKFWPFLKNGLILLIFGSILFSFLFASSEFTWGGEFGQYISGWLTDAVGRLGLVVLFLALAVALLIWNYNPNFKEMKVNGVIEDSKEYLSKTWYNRNGNKPKTPRPKPIIKEEPMLPVATTEPIMAATEAETLEAETTVPENGQLTLAVEETANESTSTTEEISDSSFEIEIPKEEVIAEEISDVSISPLAPQIEKVQQSSDDLEPYDPTRDLASYENPVLALLKDYGEPDREVNRLELEKKKELIERTLLDYKIEISKISAVVGPTVTLFKIKPAPGVRISKIKNLEDDIALSLSALGIRIIAPMPGEGVIGIEVPNEKKQIVSFREVVASEAFKRSKMQLPIAFGKTITNQVFVADLAKMPHLLIAGATGQGKSVGINVILMSLLYKKHPSQVKLVLIDPKKVELFPYAQLDHHFLSFLPGSPEPITTETSQVIHTLNSLCIEMDERYNLLKKAAVRNIKEYNEKFVKRKLSPTKGHRFLPFIVLVVDEFADLIMTAGKEVELPIGRLAQLSRAVGIHLVIATQRPSVNIITGIIKANFPARVAYKVTSKIDSRTILDTGGAEQLIGRGDMLLSVGGDMIRLQCAFVDTPEVENILAYISKQQRYPEPYFLPEFQGDSDEASANGFNLKELDDNFEDAARLIVQNQHGSTSMIQRRLKLGYNRAGRVMDQLEALGIVGPNEGSKPREVLVYNEQELEKYLQDIRQRRKG